MSKQHTQQVIFDDTSIYYTGRHLTYSQKDDKYYEWAIYVPSKDLRIREILQKCKIIFGMDPDDRKWKHRPKYHTEQLDLSYLFIENSNDFDTLIRGAMADLSDSGAVRANITYDSVLELAESIRSAEK